MKLAHARDRLALSDAVRLARHERFELALKSLVKSVAIEAVRSVPDRNLRLEVRKDVYACTM